MNDQSWAAPVARWAVWDAQVQPEGIPSASQLGFVDPMLRRRLSSLAKMVLKVANDCAHDLPAVRFVYASRHGELTRSTAMLEDLAAGVELSPTDFSVSVPIASPGLYSILRRDTAPATAVSAASESFGYGLLEAWLQLAQAPEPPVLLVYADEPAPAIYGPMQPHDSGAHAIGMLLQRGAPDTILCNCAASDAQAGNEPQSRAFLRCLQAGDSSSWQGNGRQWTWSQQPR